MSIHPDHYFPNKAPKGYRLIDRKTCPLAKGDLCWNMVDEIWHPINPKYIGLVRDTYFRVVRPIKHRAKS